MSNYQDNDYIKQKLELLYHQRSFNNADLNKIDSKIYYIKHRFPKVYEDYTKEFRQTFI